MSVSPHEDPNPLIEPEIEPENFLVCGLGSLGQHCIVALKKFGVNAIAIEQAPPPNWELNQLETMIDQLIIGDCRQDNILEAAKIHQCRAAIIATTSEQVNVETALAIRQLNPQTRIVLRSAQENLNQLLQEQLGNLIAYESTELPASAFALAALGTEVLGYFFLEGQRIRIIQRQVTPEQDHYSNRQLQEFNTRSQHLLGFRSPEMSTSFRFYNWHPEKVISTYDTLIYVELGDIPSQTHPKTQRLQKQSPSFRERISLILTQLLGKQTLQFFQLSFEQRIRRVALISGLIVFGMLLMGTFLIHFNNPAGTWFAAFSTTIILLLGGYGDIFGGFQHSDAIPWWLQLFSLGLTLVGTVFVGILYAFMTEALLSSQFQFKKNTPPFPERNHIVLVGLGRVGSRVALLLQDFKQSMVGISLKSDLVGGIFDTVPRIQGFTEKSLIEAHIATAKSVVIVTDDEVLNLEVALTAQRLNPTIPLVIRTSGARLTQHLSHLLPNAQIWDVYAVAAEVFAGAAFGENILYLFRCENQIILVTEYQIGENDGLNGLLLTDVAYGYGVVPLLHQKLSEKSQLLPVGDIRLALGDRLVILASMSGLRRIEQRRKTYLEKTWYVRVEKALTEEANFDGANIITLISDCPISKARDLMKNLPMILDMPLYHHQALRLVLLLKRNRVNAQVIAPHDFNPSLSKLD
jgi:Trk K+ transport system NAD-binding subunit